MHACICIYVQELWYFVSIEHKQRYPVGINCSEIQALRCHKGTSVGTPRVEGNEVLGLIAEACLSKWVKWDPPIQEPACRALGKSRGSTAASGEVQSGSASQHWMVRALQSRGGDRKVGGKQNTLQAPYLPTKTCCTRWVSAGRGFNLHQL